MSTSGSVWRADCRLRPSRSETALGLLAHLLAAAAVLRAWVPWWIKPPALILLAILGLMSWCRWRQQSPGAVVAFREYGEDWWLDTADGEGRRVVLLPGVLLWRWLIVLRFAEVQASGRPRTWNANIFPDSLSADEFRRLYVRLRFRRTPEMAAVEADSGNLDSD